VDECSLISRQQTNPRGQQGSFLDGGSRVARVLGRARARVVTARVLGMVITEFLQKLIAVRRRRCEWERAGAAAPTTRTARPLPSTGRVVHAVHI
jgi:hypothetical protein